MCELTLTHAARRKAVAERAHADALEAGLSTGQATAIGECAGRWYDRDPSSAHRAHVLAELETDRIKRREKIVEAMAEGVVRAIADAQAESRREGWL